MKNGTNRQPTCEWAVEKIHLQLDGDPLDSASVARLQRHLACCTDCTTAADELEQLQSSLRELSKIRLPEDTLEQVWGRTSRRRWLSAGSWSLPEWGLAAAAAILALVLIGVWQFGVEPGMTGDGRTIVDVSPDEQDVDRAVAELKMVFGVTAQALHRTETALDEVLIERISPALEKTSIPWLRPAKGKDDV